MGPSPTSPNERDNCSACAVGDTTYLFAEVGLLSALDAHLLWATAIRFRRSIRWWLSSIKITTTILRFRRPAEALEASEVSVVLGVVPE